MNRSSAGPDSQVISHGSSRTPSGDGKPPQPGPHPWEVVPPDRWSDWRWQLSHRLTSVEDFARVVDLTPEEVAGLSARDPSGPGRFHVEVTPYFASLMDPHDPGCPIRRQVIPTAGEMALSDADLVDSLAEDAHSPVPGLVHRYPDRVLMLVTTQCASYCRFCTRSRLVGHKEVPFNAATYDGQLAYIASTPQVRDVLVSGGDPLMLSTRRLEGLLRRLREIPHVEVIRIGSRVPVFLPQRITEDLVAMLGRYHPLWMNVHVNHPRELAPEVEAALARLADGGIPLGSQTVLVAGVNDCPSVMLALVQGLVRNRVRPYYLYQCDLVPGASHLRTPVGKGIEIMEALRGHTSGFAVPTFVIDAPEGGGKVPLLPNYLVSMSDRDVVVRNYEGLMSTYAQPTSYQPHEAASCPYCQSRLGEGAQEGVAGLLAGRARTIAPEGWQAAHRREASPGDNGRSGVGGRTAARPAGGTDAGSESRESGEGNVRARWRVALVCNLKKNVRVAADAPADALAEYDSMETVEALEEALLAGGHEVVLLEADETLLDTVRRAAPDVCFNIAEGLRGDARESQVPALLEMLGIPYTGSKVLAHAVSLDKAMTKRIWRDAGLPTPPFQVFARDDEGLDPALAYPLFVKPLHEGTGMGINGESVVYNERDLRRQVRWVTKTYRQPALVEAYLPGREFTVGLIGNVRLPGQPPRNDLYDARGFHLFPVLEIDAAVGAGAGLYNAASKSYTPGEEGAPLYLCPADIPEAMEAELKRLAVAAFEAVGALDLGRVDFRLGYDDRPYLLEINTLPGLNPRVSDLCIMARAEGFHYSDLINQVLYQAMERSVEAASFGAGAARLFQPTALRAVAPGAVAAREGL